MKSLKDLRNQLKISPSEISHQPRYLKRYDIDFDIFLPTKGINLQRDLVWSLTQKREIIHSMLIGRHIPHIAMLSIIVEGSNNDRYEIIDGKQRLTSIFDFMDDKFTIDLEGCEYLYSELPIEYQRAISCFHLRGYIAYEPWDHKISDDDKITWFKFINFAGTEQDKEHLEKLK